MTSTVDVEGYQDGKPFALTAAEVECGHLMRADLVPQVRNAIRAGRDTGMTISIMSAFRTMEKQQELYEKYKAGVPGYNPADVPGYSKHQDGTAIDFTFATGKEREEFAALAIAHGMMRPTHEAWHFVAGKLPALADEPPTPPVNFTPPTEAA